MNTVEVWEQWFEKDGIVYRCIKIGDGEWKIEKMELFNKLPFVKIDQLKGE